MKWWLATPDRLNKPDLLKLLQEIPRAYFGDDWTPVAPTTNQARRALIRTAQCNRRDELLREARRPPPFTGIRATEVNTWLRSLPPLQLN